MASWTSALLDPTRIGDGPFATMLVIVPWIAPVLTGIAIAWTGVDTVARVIAGLLAIALIWISPAADDGSRQCARQPGAHPFVRGCDRLRRRDVSRWPCSLPNSRCGRSSQPSSWRSSDSQSAQPLRVAVASADAAARAFASHRWSNDREAYRLASAAPGCVGRTWYGETSPLGTCVVTHCLHSGVSDSLTPGSSAPTSAPNPSNPAHERMSRRVSLKDLLTFVPGTAASSRPPLEWRHADDDVVAATIGGEYAGFVGITPLGYEAHGARGEHLGVHDTAIARPCGRRDLRHTDGTLTRGSPAPHPSAPHTAARHPWSLTRPEK